VPVKNDTCFRHLKSGERDDPKVAVFSPRQRDRIEALARCRDEMSSSHQLVSFVHPKPVASHAFVNRTGEPLAEWSRLGFTSFRSGWSHLRLFSSVLPSSTVSHDLSYSHNMRDLIAT